MIRAFADILLLNGYSIKSTGFFNGKAGISLTLFEIARLYGDNYLEEHAFELLKETLLTQNTDIGFENGLSGISFVLNYLISNKFINADHEELFGDKLQFIKKNIQKIYTTGNIPDEWISIAFSLNSKEYLSILADKPYEELIHLFSKRDLLSNKIVKSNVLHRLILLVKIYYYTNEIDRLNILLSEYAKMYKDGYMPCSYDIGYFAWKSSQLIENSNLEQFSDECMKAAKKDCHLQSLHLSEYIHWGYLLRKKGDDCEKIEQYLTDVDRDKLATKLSRMIPRDCNIIGYEGGLCRWLLYSIFVECLSCDSDVSRFDKLF